MSRNSGSRVVGPCPYCGEKYNRTNWMRRNGQPKGPGGHILSDTHLIACARKAAKRAAQAKEGAE